MKPSRYVFPGSTRHWYCNCSVSKTSKLAEILACKNVAAGGTGRAERDTSHLKKIARNYPKEIERLLKVTHFFGALHKGHFAGAVMSPFLHSRMYIFPVSVISVSSEQL